MVIDVWDQIHNQMGVNKCSATKLLNDQTQYDTNIFPYPTILTSTKIVMVLFSF